MIQVGNVCTYNPSDKMVNGPGFIAHDGDKELAGHKVKIINKDGRYITANFITGPRTGKTCYYFPRECLIHSYTGKKRVDMITRKPRNKPDENKV